MDDEYQKLIMRMNPPKAVIDNEILQNATVIQFDIANKRRFLLKGVKVLTDLNLVVTKAWICSDSGWFMDVFNVTNSDENKITDEGTLDYIQKSLGPDSCFASSMRRSAGMTSGPDHISIELTGTNQPGLLSELTDESIGGGSIVDLERLTTFKCLLCNVLKGSNKSREAKMKVSCEATHTERRLQQVMFDDRDYEQVGDSDDDKEMPTLNVVN